MNGPRRPAWGRRPSAGGRPSPGEPAPSRDPAGILVVDKPPRMTSHDVVDALRRRFGWEKVGHAGTLDPLATGVLILLVGAATREQDRFLNDDKAYRATMLLGVETDSQDADGEVTARHEGPIDASRERLEAAMAPLRGAILQTPPMVSAKKHKGKPLYKYARKGQEVEREARPVTVKRLEVVSAEGPSVTIDVECSKGTYVRTLAHDMGKSLGCGAHLTALVRTRSGPFRVEEALSLEALLAMTPGEAFEALRPIQPKAT